ncbi:MAG: hypothetical protein ACREDR_40710, partial [Blastocatellia bacterium]
LNVADTENHAIRLVDFEERTVKTIAGTGNQAMRFNASGPGLQTDLSSPWDVLLNEGSLYIAMAGTHQISKLDLNTEYVTPYAGSGREARIDGALNAAALSQPSGIATDCKTLYVADSESSSIRSVGLGPDSQVDTLAGGDLFDYGDIDGRGLKARLQHPLGVAYKNGCVYVADRYNNKIKRISLKDAYCETIFGTGKSGYEDGGQPLFNEPGGLSFGADKLYIADTNNHVVRVADLASGYVSTLEIRRLDKLMSSA